MKAGHNVFYNDSDGKNRAADRVGQALSGVKENGRIRIQTAEGGVLEVEAITGDLAQYDAEHDGGNRGDTAWPVH